MGLEEYPSHPDLETGFHATEIDRLVSKPGMLSSSSTSITPDNKIQLESRHITRLVPESTGLALYHLSRCNGVLRTFKR